MADVKRINVARDFTAYLGGRYRVHGPGSGEELRELVEQPLDEGASVTLDFDGVAGCTPSFLEEVFGGLGRSAKEQGLTAEELKRRLNVVCTQRPAYCLEAFMYLDAAFKA